MKWGRQGFLNPTDSRDDGWFKFSTELEVSERSAAVNTKFAIADCSNKSELEFDMNFYSSATLRDIDENIKSLNARRKKVQKLASAVAKWAEKTLEIYDEYEKILIKKRKNLIKV
jgi:hypothetical protein